MPLSLPLLCLLTVFLAAKLLVFFKTVAERLSFIWNKPYSIVMGWVKVRLQFAVLRATNLCLRGSRIKWRSITVSNDGCGMPALSNP